MQDVSAILPLLQCVECGGSDLDVRQNGTWREIGERSIVCRSCGAEYPATDDGIPIMWTPGIKAWMTERQADVEPTVASNIQVYDEISTDYMTKARRASAISRRMRSAARRLRQASARTNGAGGLHLDFGCGPGHVIEWLSDLGLRSVGLDVSLQNLRNTARQTGALVVLGDAQRMPFRGGLFDLVTEGSVLHHIKDWRSALRESCRVCNGEVGIVMDSEPSSDQLDWSTAARWLFDSRFYVYHVLSYVQPSKYKFRDVALARKDFWQAEIHHQPGAGFRTDEVETLFRECGYAAKVVLSPSPEVESRPDPSWQMIVLHLLSGHNPWNVSYGAFTVLAAPNGAPAASTRA